MVCERPPRSLRSRLPLTRGRSAEGGRGSLTHHLEYISAAALLANHGMDTPRMLFFFIRAATSPDGLMSATNWATYLAAASCPFGTPTACRTTVKWPSSTRVP